MRILLCYLIGTCAILADARPAEAIEVGGVTVSRGGQGSFPGGTLFDLARADLESEFGPVTWSASVTLTDDFLGTLDLLVLSAVDNEHAALGSLNAQEHASLASYVAEGGSLLLLMDNDDFLGTGLASTFGVGVDGHLFPPVQSAFLSPGSLVSSGRAGTFASFSQAFAGYFTVVPSEATVLATNPGGPSLIVFPENALGSSSGRILMYSDVQTFADDGSLSGAAYTDHAGLFINTVEYLLGEAAVSTIETSWGDFRSRW